MKVEESLRSKAAGPTEVLPTALVQSDKNVQGLLELIRLAHPMDAGSAAAEKIAIQPPQLFAVGFRHHRQIFFPTSRQLQPPAIHAAPAMHGVALVGQMIQQQGNRMIVAGNGGEFQHVPAIGRLIAIQVVVFCLRAFRQPLGQSTGDGFLFAVGRKQAQIFRANFAATQESHDPALATRSARDTKGRGQAACARASNTARTNSSRDGRSCPGSGPYCSHQLSSHSQRRKGTPRAIAFH